MLQQVEAHVAAAVEGVAQHLFAQVDLGQRDVDPSDDRQTPLGRVGDGRDGVDGRHLDRQGEAADAGHLGGQDEQVRRLGEWRQHPGEVQREGEAVGRIGLRVLLGGHGVLEAEQRPGIDVEREVEVDGALAGLLRVEIDLPGLTQRVGLDEVALVVDVEAVSDGVVLEVGHEPSHIDDSHVVPLVGLVLGRAGVPGRGRPRSAVALQPATTVRGRGAAERVR